MRPKRGGDFLFTIFLIEKGKFELPKGYGRFTKLTGFQEEQIGN